MPTSFPSVPASVLYLRDRWGGDFEEVDETVTVGTSIGQLVKNDPERVALTLINLGSDTVWVAPNNRVSKTAGIQLAAGGGNVSLTIRDDILLPTRSWYALGNSAGQSVYYVAVRRNQITGKV